MQVGATLSAQEFKDLHNGLCEVRSVRSQLENVLSPSLMARLNKGLQKIEGALNSAYDHEEDVTNKNQAALGRITEFAEIKRAVWSVEEVSADDVTTKYAFPKFDINFIKYRGVIYNFTGKNKRPMWLELFRQADKIITAANDDHIFIEEFTPVTDPDLKTGVELHTGS